MRFRLTPRERMLLIGAVVILILAAFFLGVINPLQTAVAKQREQLSLAQADFQLAREADANSATIAQRLAEVTDAWQALQLPQGAHQATLVRQIDRLRLQTGVAVSSVKFGAGAALESASSLLANAQAVVQGTPPVTPPGQLELAITLSGTQSTCVDFIGRVEALPDVVVQSASFEVADGVTATISGYLIQTTGK